MGNLISIPRWISCIGGESVGTLAKPAFTRSRKREMEFGFRTGRTAEHSTAQHSTAQHSTAWQTNLGRVFVWSRDLSSRTASRGQSWCRGSGVVYLVWYGIKPTPDRRGWGPHEGGEGALDQVWPGRAGVSFWNPRA